MVVFDIENNIWLQGYEFGYTFRLRLLFINIGQLCNCKIKLNLGELDIGLDSHDCA